MNSSSSSCPPCPGGAPLDLHTLALLTTHQLTCTDPRFVGTKLRELIFTEPWLSTVAALVDAGEGRAERGFFFDAVDVEGEGREGGGWLHPAWEETELGERECETIWWESRLQSGGGGERVSGMAGARRGARSADVTDR